MNHVLNLSRQVKQKALALGFHKVGIASVETADTTHATTGQDRAPQDSTVAEPHCWEQTPETSTFQGLPDLDRLRLQDWLAKGYHADMAWMANPKRQSIQQVMPGVKSVICVAINYYSPEPHPEGTEYAKLSRYGWGRDYHRLLHKRLKALATWFQTQGDDLQVRYYADTGPLPDKVWAEKAGIGWIAKNGNLITREYGSWVFLGEMLTTLALVPDRPHTAHCGTCTRCITACPTGAIAQPYVVDANRCLAYHTIENRAETLPAAIVPHLQGWVAGCDICQDVCPWNQRFAQPTDVPEFHPYSWNIAPTLTELATLSDAEYERRFTGSALRRIKPWMLRRNARASLIERRGEGGEGREGEEGREGGEGQEHRTKLLTPDS